jgi:hypothetical protein
MEDVLRDLARLRHYGSMLQELMSELQRATPDRSEGMDATGMVRAVLGPDGLPESFRVSSYWKQKVHPASFAAAVTQACQAAMQQRGEQWSEAIQRSGWLARLERIDDDAKAAASADTTLVPPAFRRPDAAPPRPLDVLAEEAISTMDAAMRPRPRTSAAPVTGATRGSTIEIKLSPGGKVTCAAEPRWVAERSGAQLTEALNGALSGARAKLPPELTGAAVAGAGGNSDLMAEILSVLGDPQRLSQP